MKKIVLAYSGGLDTSAIIPWLKEQDPGCEVVAFVGDVGQDPAELEGIEAKALASGAASCHVADLKEELVTEFAMPVLASGAVYEGSYLLGTSLARPILGKAQADFAVAIGADAVAHGCTGKGNDQVRFEIAYASVAPHLEVIAPWRTWSMSGREDLLDYIAVHGVPCTATREKIYSRDQNIWHVSHEGGPLEDPWNAPPEDMWLWTASPEDAPDAPMSVTIDYEHGIPVAIDGIPMSPVELLEHANAIGSTHGVGRVDLIENRVVGIKSRGCYETPGATVLGVGLQAIEELVLDRPTRSLKQELALKLAQFVYDGRWFNPACQALLSSMTHINEPLTGQAVIKLYKGNAIATQRQSPNTIYSENLATFGADDIYDQADAAGFINLFALTEKIRAMSTTAPLSAGAIQ